MAKVEGFWWEKYYLEEHFSGNIATSVNFPICLHFKKWMNIIRQISMFHAKGPVLIFLLLFLQLSKKTIIITSELEISV